MDAAAGTAKVMDSSIIWRHHWVIYKAALRLLDEGHIQTIAHGNMLSGDGYHAWASNTGDNSADAEDVAQQVMIAGIEGWEQANQDCSLMTWLWAIMLCRVADVQRQRVRDSRLIERIKEHMVDEVETDDKSARVWAVMDKLPPDKRVILTLEYLDGHSVAEVARIMGYTQRHAETEVTRARALFKRLWGDDGEDKTD